MGGAQAGEVAAGLAIEGGCWGMCGRILQRSAFTLSTAFEQAHQQVLSAAARDEELRGMGCTLVARPFRWSLDLLATVGDSRAYVFGDRACEYISSRSNVGE